jgi:hypothetical protein
MQTAELSEKSKLEEEASYRIEQNTIPYLTENFLIANENEVELFHSRLSTNPGIFIRVPMEPKTDLQ